MARRTQIIEDVPGDPNGRGNGPLIAAIVIGLVVLLLLVFVLMDRDDDDGDGDNSTTVEQIDPDVPEELDPSDETGDETGDGTETDGGEETPAAPEDEDEEVLPDETP